MTKKKKGWKPLGIGKEDINPSFNTCSFNVNSEFGIKFICTKTINDFHNGSELGPRSTHISLNARFFQE